MIKKRKSKKALSPVVATILLILLVIVLALIIFLWARGFISEQLEKFGRPINDVCRDVNFKAEMINLGGSDSYSLEIINQGNVDIANFDIKEISVLGDSKFRTFDIPVSKQGSASKDILLNFPKTQIKEIIIYPRLFGSVKDKRENKQFTCLDNGVVINNI